MIEEIKFYVIGLFCLFLIVYCFSFIVTRIVMENSKFLMKLNKIKPSEVKNRFFIIHRNSLIKQNIMLGKIIKYGLLLIVVMVVGIVFISNSNINNKYVNEIRNTYESFIKIQEDSLKTVNINYDLIIDSLQNQLVLRDSTIQNLNVVNKELNESNTNLKNVVWYQNTMIKNMNQ